MIERSCFIIMPFVPELHYFYLYIKSYIENEHGIRCVRADEKILTLPILDKIVENIKKSDILIADCSGRNPNVFYELGMAHALNKKVILITKDPINEAPSDIRHLEFISYSLDRHIEFLSKLDNALNNIFTERYEIYYEPAKKIFSKFKKDTKAQVEMTCKETFLSRVMSAERTGEIPSTEQKLELTEFVLPKIIEDNSDVGIMKQITTWISNEFSDRT